MTPGPPALSRCAPTITTFLVDPVLFCAKIFREIVVTVLASRTNRTGALVRRNAAPVSAPATATGSFRPSSYPRTKSPAGLSFRPAALTTTSAAEQPAGLVGVTTGALIPPAGVCNNCRLGFGRLGRMRRTPREQAEREKYRR